MEVLIVHSIQTRQIIVVRERHARSFDADVTYYVQRGV